MTHLFDFVNITADDALVVEQAIPSATTIILPNTTASFREGLNINSVVARLYTYSCSK